MTDQALDPSTTEATQLAEACAQSMYESDFAAQAMGITIEEMSPGRAVLSMVVRKDMLNGFSMCHGGFTFALADTAFAYACNSYNRRTVGAAAQVDYVAPGYPDDCLTAIASESFSRGRNGIYDVVVQNQHGEKLAFFKGNSRQIKGSVLPDKDTHTTDIHTTDTHTTDKQTTGTQTND